MKAPLFSIIIPTFNAESTLALALDSIVIQTYRNWEVLIMDGLSTDNTIEIAEKYQKQFLNIKIFSEKDKGIYDAMNKGIDLAKGDWLYFMGSDDCLYETTTLAKIAKQNEIKSFDVIYGNVYSTRFNGFYDGEFSYSKLITKNICHQSIFFRKSVFIKVGDFNLKYKSHADWNNNIRWFFSSKIQKLYVNQIIATYADGGFSSLNNDAVFVRDKHFLLLKKGIGKLSDSQIMSSCNNSIKFAKQERNYYKLIVSYSFKFGFKFLKKLNNISPHNIMKI